MRSIETFAYARSYLKPDHDEVARTFECYFCHLGSPPRSYERVLVPPLEHVHTGSQKNELGTNRHTTIIKNGPPIKINRLQCTQGCYWCFSPLWGANLETMTPLTIWIRTTSNTFFCWWLDALIGCFVDCLVGFFLFASILTLLRQLENSFALC